MLVHLTVLASSRNRNMICHNVGIGKDFQMLCELCFFFYVQLIIHALSNQIQIASDYVYPCYARGLEIIVDFPIMFYVDIHHLKYTLNCVLRSLLFFFRKSRNFEYFAI